MTRRPDLDPRAVKALFGSAEAAWRDFREARGDLFHPFVPADYHGALEALQACAPDAERFVELGSGVGVVTILAAWLGFEATGIEVDAWLFERSVGLAETFGVEDARFVHGSFVPDAFQHRVDESAPDLLTIADGPDAWDELGESLDEFDVVYAFPWPDQEELLEEMVSGWARPGAVLLTYDGSEGWRHRTVTGDRGIV